MPPPNPLHTRWQDATHLSATRPILDELFTNHRCVGPADLRGITISTSIAPAPFEDPDFWECHVEQIDFASASLSDRRFFKATVLHCNFDKARFDHCRFDSAKLSNCNFIQARFHNPWFEDATFTDCDFTEAWMRGSGGLPSHEAGRRIKFIRCNFRNASIKLIKMAGVVFIDCRFDGAQITKCFVFNWRFQGSAPSPNQFQDCEYRGLNTGLSF